MKHTLLAALILLAGCAAEHERTEASNVAYGTATEPEPPAPGRQDAGRQATGRETPLPGTSPISTSSLAPLVSRADPKAALDRALRNERLVYAQGLERILLTNGMPASVRVHEEGQAGPVPALMFFGQFSHAFVHRAVTEGAVLERARALGFRSVEFIDRGPGGNYLFELARTGPLPKCAAYNRLCL
jgi:hypothetical protein